MDGLDDLDTSWDSAPDDGFSEEPEVSSEAQYLRDLRVNSAIREIFLNRFVHLFIDYDHFIIQPNQVSLYVPVFVTESLSVSAQI